MKKYSVAVLMIFCTSILLSACGNDESAKTSTSAARADVNTIVFHQTIEDPQKEVLDTLGGNQFSGTAELEMTLYETGQNRYEGYGILTRTWTMPDSAVNMKQEYVYRTGLIHAEGGKGTITFLCSLTEDRDAESLMGERAPHMISHKEATLMQQDVAFLLNTEGEKATFTFQLHDQAKFVFEGQVAKGSGATAFDQIPDEKGVLYINSLWSSSDSESAGGYTAILAAVRNVDKQSYSGQLSLSGKGTALARIDQPVTFSVEPYEASAYQRAGGMLTGQFSNMGMLHTKSGDFILLFQGKNVVLEYAGKRAVFCGKLFPNEKANGLKNEAAKTRTMLSSLDRGAADKTINPDSFQGLDPNDPEDRKKLMEMSEALKNSMGSENGVPAWYPDGLIPKVNFSEYDGYLTTPIMGQQIFPMYNTQYFENEDFEDLVAPYRKGLSAYDHYQEYLDYDNREGVFLFTMGRYSLQVFLQQSNLKLTSIDVLIY